MKRLGVWVGLGLWAGLAVGCGGTGPGHSASGAVTGKAPAYRGAATPAWRGAEVWGDLSKLQNYAFRSTIVVGAAGGSGSSVTFSGRYHSPDNYQLVMSGLPGSDQGVTITAAGGHYYMGSAGSTADLGTDPGLAATYTAVAEGAWEGLFRSSTATYVGACVDGGRRGNAYRLTSESALAGTGQEITGTACLDAATGAPLHSDLKWSMAVGSKIASFEDRLQITSIGNVPPIPAPAGAQTLPGGGRAGG